MSILYKETAARIIEYIKALPSGTEKLPSERELCSIFKVSRQTVRHALDECEEKGFICKRQGSGIYLTASYQKSINKIALLVPDRDDYIYPGLIYELESRFSALNYSLDIYETNGKTNTLKEQLINILNNPVSSVIIFAIRNALSVPFTDIFHEMSSKGINILFIGNPFSNLKEYSYIKQDDYFGAYSIASRVIAHSKPWCGFFMHDNIASYDKYLGLTAAFDDLNIEYDEDQIKWFSYLDYKNLDKRNSTLISNLLTSLDYIPSVFICDNDQFAYWLIKTLKKNNYYNEDMTIYSFDCSYILKISDHKIYSYGTDEEKLILTIIDKTVNKTKRTKEVITLPSSLHE